MWSWPGLLESSIFQSPCLFMHSPNTIPHHASPRDQYHKAMVDSWVYTGTPQTISPHFKGNLAEFFYMHSIYMTLVNLQEKYGKDLISGRGILGGNSPFFVATIRG